MWKGRPISKKARDNAGETKEESRCPPHPGHIGGMCMKCGGKVDHELGVKVTYIHKDLRLASDEIARLRDKDLENILHHKKLHLVLDLDHTLLNSTEFANVTAEELKLVANSEFLPASCYGSLFKLNAIQMMTKLRPHVHTFLKEANKLFELHICTKAERSYALQMAKLLDPGDVYFHSMVIAREDCTQKKRKGLDIFLLKESSALILDDTEEVWDEYKDNLILMERYHFFASSCKQFNLNCKSLSQLKHDENENDGALASILKILKRVHSLYFEHEHKENLLNQDVREVLKAVRKEVLTGCKIVFSRIFPKDSQAEDHHLWKMAERLGATCSTKLDMSITHVVSLDVSTEKSIWAVNHKKFLVHPRWVEACGYLWLKQPEERFPVKHVMSSAPSVK